MSLIQTGQHQPRNPVDLDADMRARVSTLEHSWGLNGMGADFSQMMSQMTGQPMNLDAPGPDNAFGGVGHIGGGVTVQGGLEDLWATGDMHNMSTPSMPDPMGGLF